MLRWVALILVAFLAGVGCAATATPDIPATDAAAVPTTTPTTTAIDAIVDAPGQATISAIPTATELTHSYFYSYSGPHRHLLAPTHDSHAYVDSYNRRYYDACMYINTNTSSHSHIDAIANSSQNSHNEANPYSDQSTASAKPCFL